MNELNNLYAFDGEYTEVSFNARPNAAEPHIVYHRLRKPTLQELIDRENQITYEMVEINSREEEIRADDEMANARFWDKIILAVKGYKGADDWRELTGEEKAQMRPGHKGTAIRALYAGVCEIEGDADGVSIAADTWTVRQEIGAAAEPAYIVRHILREPTEAERVKFKRSASSTSYIKGSKKSQVRVRTNLRAYVELYNALIERIHGGHTGLTVHEDGIVDPVLREAIDPIWKRQVIQCLMSALEAQLSD